jgi:hypothetical protein
MYPIAGGEPTAVPGAGAGESYIQWTPDGKFLFVSRVGEIPLDVQRLELATGRREPWKTLAPPDLAGISQVQATISYDASAYLLSYARTLSDLYVMEGIR